MLKFLISSLFLLLTCCSIVPVIPIAIEDAVERIENASKEKIKSTKLIEKPYQVDGKWFYPQEYSYLEEVGIAMHLDTLKTGNKTKNGEIYHDEILMGAHRSLPLPSIVRVTNLSNGYSVRVRVNHRGAFSNTNIINLSSEVFNKLKLRNQGDLVRINLSKQNETFILNEAFTYDEEKKVAEAPVSLVTIGSIDESTTNQINKQNEDVNISLDGFKILDDYKYNEIYIRIASFSFQENAQKIVDSINNNHDAKIIEHFNNDGVKAYMVVIGPFKNIDNLIRILKDDTFDKYEDLSIFLI